MWSNSVRGRCGCYYSRENPWIVLQDYSYEDTVNAKRVDHSRTVEWGARRRQPRWRQGQKGHHERRPWCVNRGFRVNRLICCSKRGTRVTKKRKIRHFQGALTWLVRCGDSHQVDLQRYAEASRWDGRQRKEHTWELASQDGWLHQGHRQAHERCLLQSKEDKEHLPRHARLNYWNACHASSARKEDFSLAWSLQQTNWGHDDGHWKSYEISRRIPSLIGLE